jgi:metal-sulfur cluster biosynthetic enzyme
MDESDASGSTGVAAGRETGSALPIVGSGRRVRYEDGMNFAAILRETQGGGMKLPDPPAFAAPPVDLTEAAHRALYEVSDPEFPISLVDLGLVYGVEADEETGAVAVSLSFTATACPCMDFIKWDVRERLLGEPGVTRVDIETVWDPPWTTDRISERGREIMRRAGVSV